ncbi:pneumococcal serine-rich repeat protein-like [Dermacentor albipictus]|uniref:pneumococcal serine-rich repeat protein-like n=1 Tax=Dermacentor albipictus TaxID=60249 RepID=UPI0038FCC857
MAGHAVSLTCLISTMFVLMVAGQHAVMDVGNPFDSFQDSFHGLTGSHSSSDTVDAQSNRTAPTSNGGKGVFGGTSVVLGFGSECSLERQCNVLLGLACTSNGARVSRCACAPSTPVYVDEGGVQKCVRPKELYEACVSNQECSFKNPNVRCVNFLCKCSQPFQLSPGRLCLLPSGPAGNIFPTAISVMLVLALLVAAGGYAYQKMLRERERSSSLSTKAGLSLQADTSSASSTARMLGGRWAWGRRCEYREGECNVLEDTDEPRRLRTQSEISLPRHPPRYISHKGSSRRVTGLSTLHECCSNAERSSSLSGNDRVSKDEPEKSDTPLLLHRTPEKRDLVCQQKREIEAKPERSVHSSSSPIHVLLPEDEQMRRILSDDQEIVVTVETGKGRHHLVTTPSLPPVFSLPRREPPPSESTMTDDSFMKDLKRRRGRLRGRHSAELPTAVTTSTLRTTSAGVTTTLPSDAGMLAAVHTTQQVNGPPAMRGVFGLSAPVRGFPASTEPAKQQTLTTEPVPTPASEMTANAVGSNVEEKANAPTQTSTTQSTPDRRPRNYESGYRSMRGTYDTIESRSSVVPVTNTLPSLGIRLQSAERNGQNSKGSDAEQGTVSMKTVLGATVLHSSTKDEGQKQVCVLDDLDILAACAKSAEKAHMAKQKTEPQTGPSCSRVTESPPTACPKTDIVAELHPSEAKNYIEKSDQSHRDRSTPVTSAIVNGSLTSCTAARPSPTGQFLCSEKWDSVRSEENIAQVAEIASQLLLGMAELHVEKARASSLDANVNRCLHCVPRIEAVTPSRSCGAARPSPVILCFNEERTEPTVEKHVDVITSDVKHDAKLGKHRLPTKFNYSSSDEPRDCASEDYVSEKARTSNSNAAAPIGVLKPSKAISRAAKAAAGQFKPREVAWPSLVEIINTSSEMWPRVKFASASPSPPAYGLNQEVADDAKLSSHGTSQKTPQQGTHSVLEDRHASAFNGGADATEKELKFDATREPGEGTVEMRNNSPSFAEAAGLRRTWRRRASASSVFSETTPSLSFQKPYQELMAKISQHPVHFTERPFVDVLASMESEFTSIVKDEQRVELPDEKEKTPSEPPKLPDTGGHPGSDTDDGNLDETALRSFLADDEENYFEADTASDEAVETCTSADSAKLPSRRCPPSSGPAMKMTVTTTTATATTLESEGASKPRALLDHSASDKDLMPPSKSLSLAIGSSNTSCNTSNRPSNPDELRSSEQTVAAVAEAATCKTVNGVDPSTELQVTATSVVRSENLQLPTSLRSDICAQTQLPVPGTSVRLSLSNHQSRVATDRPWIEEVEKVATLGNEHYIHQHAALQRASNSATRLDETQCVLFHAENPKQLTMSVKSQQPAPGSVNTLSSVLTQSSHELIQGALNYPVAPSLSTDIERHESQATSFEPPKLKVLTARKVPDGDIKRVLTIRLSKASNVPPLRELCSQVLPPAEAPAEKYAAPAGRNDKTPSCSSCARLETSPTATASPYEPPSKKKGPKARLSLDALSDKTAIAALEEEGASSETRPQLRRRGRSQSVVITGVSHEWSDQRPSPTEEANAAAVTRNAKVPIRSIGPPASQNIVVLPDSSVAIRLPEGARSTDLWAPASSTSLRRGSAATGLVIRNRHLQLASALEDPSFESIYNAILQAAPPPAENALQASGPGDVPCRPARRASSSSRAVSFDNMPTVVPLEPPPEPFVERDVSKTAVDAEPAATPPPFHRPRRRSSLCRSSSGSLLQEVTESADLSALLASRRPSCLLPPFLVESGATRDDAASSAKEEAGPDATLNGGAAAPTEEQRSPLASPFYSFEDTMSELSSVDANNLSLSGSFPESQRNEGVGPCDQNRGSSA